MATQEQVDKNYQAFKMALAGLLEKHKGKFALMHDGEIIEFFDTPRDAYVTGQRLYSDLEFSVQEITANAVDLGFFSYAVPQC